MSSAGQDLGCYITRAAAETKQRETGQDRLLAVIGKTARLEQRQVLSHDPARRSIVRHHDRDLRHHPEQATPACSFQALADKDVVYLDKAGTTKYRLGPVVISGDQVTKATARC